MKPHALQIPARDGFLLGGTLYGGTRSTRVVLVNGAMGVPSRFYRHFAGGLVEAGYSVVCWDYRGVGLSRPRSLKGFPAEVTDWAFLDLAGAVDWLRSELGSGSETRLFLVGHSVGGQIAGLIDNPGSVDAMVTLSAQSGYWRLQGGEQKWAVLAHGYLTLPLVTRLCGYSPWKRLGLGEDLPRGVALQWARWLRNPKYLLGDKYLLADAARPLERYAEFTAPVLAYSFDDDKWGTARAVDAMMRAYPNLERRHVTPADHGLRSIGHVGFFRPESSVLWEGVVEWLDGI